MKDRSERATSQPYPLKSAAIAPRFALRWTTSFIYNHFYMGFVRLIR